jgi:hypothetical protein
VQAGRRPALSKSAAAGAQQGAAALRIERVEVQAEFDQAQHGGMIAQLRGSGQVGITQRATR